MSPVYYMQVYPVRYPKKHIKMMEDIAHNKGVKVAELFREAINEFLGTYSTIPSLKEVFMQVDRHEKKLAKIERALLKKGIVD